MKRLKHEETGIGFDALNEKYVNMVEARIADPTKVTRSALQNAASSVASMVLTTEAAVVDIGEEEQPMPAGGRNAKNDVINKIFTKSELLGVRFYFV